MKLVPVLPLAVFVSAAAFGLAQARTAGTRAAATPTQPVLAKVVYVDDGDTLVALLPDHQQLKVRLANIDAPETGHGHCRPGQPHSDQSGRRLAELVKGRQVELRCMDTDRYGRSVCDVVMGSTTANRILVQEGLAWANRGGNGYVRDRAVYELEDRARAAHVGLWQDRSPTPPWVWRHTEWLAPQPGCVRKGDRS
ncbi:thermonuclease family protein [Ramlibacter sp. AN1133]|uniref:thermonuclease family protein n=1 Tax=Ramlibacter sp. AN1133 TaxID=3133429 RepID=UPI0030C017C3